MNTGTSEMVPTDRIRLLNAAGMRPDGAYVLYWMVAYRRVEANFALEHAVTLARQLARPVVVFEPLRVDYPWASDRLHQFVIEGMAENARRLSHTPVRYLAHVERARGDGRRLFEALAARAAAIVTDDSPAFFLPAMLTKAAARLAVRLEAVDSNGILPIDRSRTPFATAFAFRAAMQRTLRGHLPNWPSRLDWHGLPALPDLVLPEGTPCGTDPAELARPASLVATLPIDHRVGPAPFRGGADAAQEALARFITFRLPAYVDIRNHPDLDGTSRLSPYLHFGHISAHEIFDAVMTAARWTSRQLSTAGGGRREGWWGLDANSEAFLDQLITWRELGYSSAALEPDRHTTVDALPHWARRTLEEHLGDARPIRYSREELESGRTHDRVWNAAQHELTREGWMHNYLRMLWGKRLLEWSATPEEALDTMSALMDRHAVDGRDPNSYAGYTWTLGRYDRPWGPARPIFGTVRYMSSANTIKKLKIKSYLDRYA